MASDRDLHIVPRVAAHADALAMCAVRTQVVGQRGGEGGGGATEGTGAEDMNVVAFGFPREEVADVDLLVFFF